MNWENFLPPILYRRRAASDRPLIDGEYIEESVERSPVSVVLVLVFIWISVAVMLTVSDSRQRDMLTVTEHRKSPFPVLARCDFSYTDNAETRRLREKARADAPAVYRVDPSLQIVVEQETKKFFQAVAKRDRDGNDYEPADDLPSKLAAELLEFKAISKACRLYRAGLRSFIASELRYGIAGRNIVLPERPVKVISSRGNEYLIRPPDIKIWSGKMADAIQLTGAARREFIDCIAALSSTGTVVFDELKTHQEEERAANAVTPVVSHKKQGDLLIERGEVLTAVHADMLKSEKQTLRSGFGAKVFFFRVILSLLILAIALFFLYFTNPDLFRSIRRVALGGTVIILALAANFGALQLFLDFFTKGIIREFGMVFFFVPITFGAALMSVLQGHRSAIFSGFAVASLTALMIMPDRSFELALRWFAISALMSFIVRNVRNYRSFFIRVLLGSIVLNTLINIDILVSFGNAALWKITGEVICANAFICSVCGLLLVFAFELIFNTETNMSLVLLCDFSHPLLEKLKREAPGTMMHSMTVATLAEDAARAIHANPLRAKAGALFHDIGKLSMPQYFVENNVDSPKDHEAMPPQRSCGIIRGHVKEGLALARRYRMSRLIRDAISTHHGDDLISFFYRRALEENAANPAGTPQVLETQFRYDGEPPTEKELTIISLADACEAASRSLHKPTPAKLESLVNEIFLGRMRGGQLRNSTLTLEELNTVRECFIADLISINHGRIAY